VVSIWEVRLAIEKYWIVDDYPYTSPESRDSIFFKFWDPSEIGSKSREKNSPKKLLKDL
jgi:hypothetical protein